MLTGEIPEEIGNLTYLEELDISDNLLTGEIPEEIGNLTYLEDLNISNNLLTGEIPEDICNQGDVSPTLYNNQLCPPYPECIEGFIGYQDTSECVEYQLGDVNQDDIINILDVVTGVYIILDVIEYTNYQQYLLDYNQDGETNILDILALVNYILAE